MTRGSFFFKIVAILFYLFAFSLLAVVFFPYPWMKFLLDFLSRDGNLSLFTPDNAIAFRFLIGVASLGVLTIAFITFRRAWKNVLNFLGRSWRDLHSFCAPSLDLKKEAGFWIALLVVTGFSVVTRLAGLQKPMAHDESYTVVTFADTIFHAMTDYSLPNNHVFHTLLVNISVKVLGLAPWTVRLPAFLAGILIVPGVYFLAKRIYDSWTGLAASILVAFSPSLIDFSVNARGYTLVALCTLIILLLGHYVRKNKNIFAWVLISLFSALGLYTVPVMLFPFGILFLWLFLENWATSPDPYPSRREFLKYWLASGLLAALLTWLLYTPVLIYTGPEKLFANGFVAPLPWSDLPDTWRARLTDTWAEWTSGVSVLIVVVLGLGWVLGLIFHRRLSSGQTVPLQLAAFLWIAILLVVQRSNAWEKVWVFLLPLMLIWSTAGIIGLMRNVRLKLLRNLSLAGTVTGVMLLAGFWSTVRTVPKLPELLAQRGDVENVVLFLKSRIGDTDLIVVDWPDDASTWFYALEYGLDNAHFDKRIPYTQAWIVVNPPDGQTVESVLSDRGPDQPALDLAAIQLDQVIGTRQIYVCPIQ